MMLQSSSSNHWLINDDYSNDQLNLLLLTLRKPTELKKLMDSIPKPVKAVPKNGLPRWYKLGLESKLSVPYIPKGQINFSRGKVGQNIRRVSIRDGHVPDFDLSDPYCHNISYEYIPLHDHNLANYFAQKPARSRMQQLGFITNDGRAVCTLKEFNDYRKLLYKEFMDRMHEKMRKLDELALDDLTLSRVDGDIARRKKVFIKTEAERAHLERTQRMNAAQWDEKKRLAKEQEQKAIKRMQHLTDLKEKQRKEHAARSLEKEKKIKQRTQAAAEIELKRKITMIKQWRINENKRKRRLKHEKEDKARRQEEEVYAKWLARIQEQTKKIHEESLLLQIYSEDMTAAAARRMKKSQVKAYERELALQKIKLANLKLVHGEKRKSVSLAKKMGKEFEKSVIGARGMTKDRAHQIAIEAMKNASSIQADRLVVLGQARRLMDKEVLLPSPPLKLLEEILETVILEFSRRQVNKLLRDIERKTHYRAREIFLSKILNRTMTRHPKHDRWSKKLSVAVEQPVRGCSSVDSRVTTTILFGDITHFPSLGEAEVEMKSVRDRPPTPVPSKTKLAEVIFLDRISDLPDPVINGSNLPERRKLLEMVNTTEKLLNRVIFQHVEKGIDIKLGQVTLPTVKHSMEWGEAVEALASAVVDNRISSDCGDIRRIGVYIASRILRSIREEFKKRSAMSSSISSLDDQPFYQPDKIKEN